MRSIDPIPGQGTNAALAYVGWGRLFALLAIVTTLSRLAILFVANHDLGPDEAQYWFWSRTPALGYYSKPPLIAWSIAATTALFGNGEAAVRASAPLFHAATATFLFILGRELFDSKVGFWAGVTWLLTPGVILSSMVISTDAPLLSFWSLSLLLFFRLAAANAEAIKRATAIALGIAIGAGFLAKYAMIYFPLCMCFALFAAPSIRKRINRVELSVVGFFAIITATPNILWNARNDFQTVSHTAANANWGQQLLHPIEFLEFAAAQFGVVGPLLMPAIGLALVASTRGSRPSCTKAAERLELHRALASFVAPILLIIAVQSLLSRAHANWAAAAYPAGILLAVAFALSAKHGKNRTAFNLVRVSAPLHILAFGALSIALIAPASADAIGVGRALAQLRGWEKNGADVIQAARVGDFDAIVADDRDVLGGLTYYANGAGRFAAFDSNNRIDHHYEAFLHFDPRTDKRILYVTENEGAIALTGRFKNIQKIGESIAPTGNDRVRKLYLFSASEYVF